MDRVLQSYGVPGPTSGNRVELARDGQEAYRQLIRLIDGAERTIHITTYILGRDEVGKAIVERLARRSAEGVRVRLLLDSVGSWRVGRRTLAPMLEAGARVAWFMPVIHIPFRGRANLRNHRKIVVVDDRHALAGGMNLAGEYMGRSPTRRGGATCRWSSRARPRTTSPTSSTRTGSSPPARTRRPTPRLPTARPRAGPPCRSSRAGPTWRATRSTSRSSRRSSRPGYGSGS